MSSIDRTIRSLDEQQEIELAQALAQIQDSPGKLQAFSNTRINELMNIISQEHSDTAVKNFSDMQRSNNSLNNILYYHARNKDLDRVQASVLDRSTAEALGAQHDSQLAKRQFEINEWSAANKAETLFLMQLFLMAVTFTIFMLFLNRIGVLLTFVFTIIASLIFIAFILTFAIRYQYTTHTRSNRYWNRNSYPDMSDNMPTAACPGVSGYSFGDTIANAQAGAQKTAADLFSGVGDAFTTVGNGWKDMGTSLGGSKS